jgi:hypothetical protein
MKYLLPFLMLIPAVAISKSVATSADVSAQVAPDGGRIVVEARGVKPEAPLFFSATADNTVRIDAQRAVGEIHLDLRIIQGWPAVITLGLAGAGDVTGVAGDGLRDWAVRQAGGNRFLDIRPTLQDGRPAPGSLKLTIRTQVEKPSIPGMLSVPILTPGDAVGFASQVSLVPGPSVDLRVTDASGFLPIGEQTSDNASRYFYTTGGNERLEVKLVERGGATADAELDGARLTARLDEVSGCVRYELVADARVSTAGARLPFLSGAAALEEPAGGDGWHVELKNGTTELVFDRAGAFPIKISFSAALAREGDWQKVNFQMPAGTVVPMQLEGFPQGVTFDENEPIVPDAASLAGFIPADGAVRFGWRRMASSGEGTLFFASHEQSDVRVGAGLLRQVSRIDFQILQGKLPGIKIRLDGPGEILGVEGASILGWKVAPEGDHRVLDVRLSRPFEKSGSLIVRSQVALGSFPVSTEPLRLTPEDGVRNSGFLRVANDGAVRLEMAGTSGLMQLSPEQYPGDGIDGEARQVFVYRFPSASYSCRIGASQILPEVGVSQVLVYQLGDTDRIIRAAIELDIREAPLREWSLRIPADYAVASVSGSGISDYAAESESAAGMRKLKILFDHPVDGRELVQLQLEKNQPAAAGEWQLPPLEFPGAKSVRGHVGVVAAAGFRVAPGASKNLAEMPLSYFPTQLPGLQQSWRLRSPDWAALVKVEALGQSVQADVFHLYTLKEGVVDGSVLINYYVVGAPANEWRIHAPKSLGNIDVVGQNVSRDWRRDGDEIIVPLRKPVLGPATVLVTFEYPMSARGGLITPGEVRPLGVQSERGILQVVSPFQVKSKILKSDGGLLKLEPSEVPAEFRLLTSSPSVAVYQYIARPFALDMSIEWYAPAETIDQLLDFARLASHVSRDGQVVTDIHYFVKTRGRKDLRLTLPEGVKLWEARANQEIVSARMDQGQIIVPLPPRTNPNEPVEVLLRLGQASNSARNVNLSSPKAEAPTVISEWTITADPGQLLAPKGGTVALDSPPLTETGFEWISARATAVTVFLLALLAATGWCRSGGPGWRSVVGFLLAAIVSIGAVQLAFAAATQRHVNTNVISCSAVVVPPGDAVTAIVSNVPAWQAMISWWGVAAGVAGAALVGLSILRAWLRHDGGGLEAASGVGLLVVAILLQRGGAIVFFQILAGAAFLAVMVPVLVSWLRRPKVIAEAAAALVAAAACLAFTSSAHADDARPAEAMIQSWKIVKGRLHGEIDLRVRGVAGDSFILLRPPAVLTSFSGDGLRVTKVARGRDAVYYVALDRDGAFSGHASFDAPEITSPFAGTTWRAGSVITLGLDGTFSELWRRHEGISKWVEIAPDAFNQVNDDGAVLNHFKLINPTTIRRAEDGVKWSGSVSPGIPLLTGPAALQKVTVQLDEGGWEFVSDTAVSITPLALPPGESGATIVFRAGGQPAIRIRPRTRDVAAEQTQFYAEESNLFVPGPGVVNGYCRVTIRPVQGRVTDLELVVPKGFTVGDVSNGPVGSWRFDPIARKLRLNIAPEQTGNFQFDVATQLGTGDLPSDLALQPIRVAGALGEVGMIGLAFGEDAQPEDVHGPSPVNIEDFDSGLVPKGARGRPLATIQQVFRYGREGGDVTLRVAAVAPEIRTITRQVLSLGDERLLMAVDMHVSIMRAGLFQLALEVPDFLEVESITGPALNNWVESREGSRRVITLHLTGRTIGEQNFHLAFIAPAPPVGGRWEVPRLSLLGAARQTGQIFIVPDKGIRLRAMERKNVSYLDPSDETDAQPGTIAFRLLQEDWSLGLGIEALEPWVTAQALEDVTLREGQTLTRIGVRFHVENAAVKQLRVRLPELTNAQVQTIRASGAAISDFTKVAGEKDLWDIHFQRGITGDTDVQIEYQGESARAQDNQLVRIPTFLGARQVTQYVAVRGGGRLEIDANAAPRGWQPIDWSSVPEALQNSVERSVPALCFRVAEPEAPLAVNIHRLDMANALKLRVKRGELTTLFSADGPAITSVRLSIDVVEKGSMRLRLPSGARLMSAFMNGGSAQVVRDGDAYLLNVAPNTDSDPAADVRFVYSTTAAQHGGVRIDGPSLDVPLENVSWNFLIPNGSELTGYKGSLRLTGRTAGSVFGVKDYKALSTLALSSEARKANDLIVQANSLLRSGQQLQAGEVLSRAANANTGDEAFNEDARVQLRSLKTQQAVVGLNTRRQRLYLDNRFNGMAVQNQQMEQAASQNVVMQGSTNFDLQQADQYLLGNSADENSALRGIADRIVEQQLSAEPAPAGIDVTLPKNGRVVSFARSIQVDGEAPLSMRLDLSPSGGVSIGNAAIVLIVATLAGAFILPRRRKA